MADSHFIYAIYIRTTPEKLWQALIDPEFTRKYWMETSQECSWQVGAAWQLVASDGRVCDAGEVLEIDPPKRLVLKWQHRLTPEIGAEGFSRMTYTLEPLAGEVKLTVQHEIDVPNSKLIKGVSNGWPKFLSSVKSLLETGEALESTRKWPASK